VWYGKLMDSCDNDNSVYGHLDNISTRDYKNAHITLVAETTN